MVAPPIVNATMQRQVWCICRVKAVWSIPERFMGSYDGALYKLTYLYLLHFKQ